MKVDWTGYWAGALALVAIATGAQDPTVWGQNPDINNGYPYLLDNPPPH